jgi:trimethylamine--corrinoid protein Co-methyltransferase
VENAVSGAVSQFAKADMMCGAGLTHAATIFSFEQLIMDCEIFDIVRNVAQGIDVTEETLAVDVVNRVGPKNHFMTDPHTLKHMRSAWQPTVMDRSSYSQWEAAGEPHTQDHAKKLAKRLLASHEPEPLANEAALLEIIQGVEAGFDN